MPVTGFTHEAHTVAGYPISDSGYHYDVGRRDWRKRIADCCGLAVAEHASEWFQRWDAG